MAFPGSGSTAATAVSYITILSSNNIPIPVDSLGKTINRNGDGSIAYIEVTYQSVTYRQTYSYTGNELTSVTAWIPQ